MHSHFVSIMLLGAALAAPVASAAAVKPTPVPGGANQVQGVAGSLGSTLFNGQVRVRKMSLGKPDLSANESYADDSTSAWIAYHALMSNGTGKPMDMEQFTASIVDADGIAVAAQPDKVRPLGSVNGIPPGGAWKEAVFFAVPRGFKPVKIVLQPADSHYKAFRISISPSQAPAT